MKYLWNNFSSPLFNVDIGVKQGSALPPVLSALYLSHIFHIFEKRLKNLKILISIISFVDDGLFVFQEKSLDISKSYLFCSYHVISSLLKHFGLVIEHRKTEVFHFSRIHGVFNPPLLDLTTLEGPAIRPKKTWHYLGFIFTRKLIFSQHINFYTNKVLLTIKCMKMLGNSTQRLILSQKYLLYRTYVLSIALYNFPL